LRTPRAAITGAATTLLEENGRVDAAGRRELTQTICEEAEHLNRLIRNILNMTRLESGAIWVTKEWQSLEEIVGVVLNRLGERLGDRPMAIRLPSELPLVPFDPLLIEQVVTNLLENALKYTPQGTPLELSATVKDGEVEVVVADRGLGLPSGEEERIFEKFVRGAGAGHGVGLGLAICRSIVVAHGGRIWAENRTGGGAAFRFTLPLGGTPPLLEPEEES
jgi:two-component system sensor histidine kinase KdpD